MNTVALVGRLTKDPELRYIEVTGTPVATFTLAVNRDFTKKDGTREADFIPIEVMGKGAEYVANYISKGRLVELSGSIRVDNYQTQTGEKRTFTKVNCRSVNPLEKAKDNNGNNETPSAPPTTNTNEPGFEPSPDLDPKGFGAVEDNDIPF